MQEKVKDTPETLRLIKLAQEDDPFAKNKLVLKYSSYFEYLVNKYSKKTWIKDDDDLRSYIYMGFLEGIKHFDPTKNTQFIYFAHIWMKKQIFLGEGSHRFVRLPANQKVFYDRFLNEYRNMEMESIEYYDIDDEDVAQMVIIENSSTRNFSTYLVHDESADSFVFPETVFEKEAKEAVAERLREETQAVLRNNINEILSKFNNKEVFIIEHTFGLNGKSVMTSGQIAEALGFTKVNITFIKNKVIRLMRHSSLSNIILKEVF